MKIAAMPDANITALPLEKQMSPLFAEEYITQNNPTATISEESRQLPLQLADDDLYALPGLVGLTGIY